MKDVAAYIAGKGCRQPAYITADISISPSKERYEGFVEGLEENGISFNKRMHYAGTFSVETGQIGAMTLLQRNPEIDCIVCGNDLMAIGAVSVCEKLGKKIPEALRSWKLLTGKYKKRDSHIRKGSRATHQADKQINNLLTDENLAIVDELSKVADDLGTNVAILSLAWILKHPEISCVIAGASKPSQLENNLKAVIWRFRMMRWNGLRRFLDSRDLNAM